MSIHNKDLQERYANALDAINPNKMVDRAKLDTLLAMAKKDPNLYRIATSKGYEINTTLFNTEHS